MPRDKSNHCPNDRATAGPCPNEIAACIVHGMPQPSGRLPARKGGPRGTIAFARKRCGTEGVSYRLRVGQAEVGRPEALGTCDPLDYHQMHTKGLAVADAPLDAAETCSTTGG